MTASDLPLGFASFIVVETAADGVESVSGLFASRALAEQSAAFLRVYAPLKTFTVTSETPVLPGLEGRV